MVLARAPHGNLIQQDGVRTVSLRFAVTVCKAFFYVHKWGLICVPATNSSVIHQRFNGARSNKPHNVFSL